MGLISLVYTSVAIHPMTEADLRSILEVSRKNNALLSITGMLLYKDGNFIQLLEGEENWVYVVYNKIVQDSRHTKIYKMSVSPLQRRSFSDWSMGFNMIDTADLAGLEGFTDFLKEPFDPMFLINKPSRAMYLLESFKSRSVF